MNSDEREQLQRLREMHQRTREVLEQQKAQFGSYVPTHIELQLQDVNRQIGDIEKKLANPLPEHVINIDFWTRAGAHPHTPNAKSIDWTQYFEPKLPEPITWKDTLLPNLQAQILACEAEQCCDMIGQHLFCNFRVLLGNRRCRTAIRVWGTDRLCQPPIHHSFPLRVRSRVAGRRLH